jgi:DNA-directed RNA polymerase specialized sigma24 family protein
MKFMDPDTDIGGPLHKFPVTNHSAIVGARSDDEIVRRRAFDTILNSYWTPDYKYVRLKWQATNEDAKDLTQGFFANAFEKHHFASYDATKASFQTFLRTCLDGFVANEHKAGKRLKRGGDMDHYQLDFAAAEAEFESTSTLTPEDYFHREWVRSMFTAAVETFRERCVESNRLVHFQIFERYDLNDDDVSYASLAEEFGLEASTLNNYLAAARRDFRRIVMEKFRETM